MDPTSLRGEELEPNPQYNKAVRLPLVLLLATAASAQSDFEAARWILRQSGRLRLAGGPQIYERLKDLPATPFRVEAVDLIGADFNPNDLKHLSTLTEVRELLLPGPIFNPGAGSRLDANAEFAALAPLTKLEKLHLSLHFLTEINVRDKGLEHLKALTNITELRLSQTRIKGPSLAPFTNLEKLDLNYTTFGDDGLKYLSGMTRLSALYLRDTLVTDKGLPALGALASLEYLDLSGARLTDAGLAHLKSLTKLKSLNLLGAELTDGALETLTKMTELEELNLYRSQISNAGLKKLEALRRLRHLDLRYSRVSRSGIESLAKALPACKTEFVDVSAAAVDPKVRNSRPAAATDEAVAAWVPQIGGSAHFRNGRLHRLDLSRTPVTEEQLAYLTPLTIQELRLDSTELTDSALAKLPSTLKYLNLSHTAITNKALASLPPQLKALDLSNTAVGDAAVAQLPSTLTELSLAYTGITDAGIKALAAKLKLTKLDLTATDLENDGLTAIAQLTQLTDLRINYGRYNDKGVAALVKLTRLEHLEMTRTRLTDEGLKSLANLPLKTLRADYTAITDKGLALLPLTLEELRLDTASVSDEGIDTLSTLKNLKLLNLYHTTVTEKGYAKLKAALPDCQIIYDRDSAIPIRRKS